MLYFVTSNQQKIKRIQSTLEQFGIPTEVKGLELQEIQSDSIEEIAIHKAHDAFNKIKSPLFVVDDGWFITALKGFPGAYMKKVNATLTSDDLLRLMGEYENRDFTFKQVLTFIDEKESKTFSFEAKGKVLNEVKGNGIASNNVLSFKDGLSLSEMRSQNIRMIDDIPFWEEFAAWLKANNKV